MKNWSLSLIFLFLLMGVKAQHSVNVSIFPIQISGIIPFQLGMGYEYRLNPKIGLAGNILFTGMEDFGSGDGGYFGTRLTTDFKWYRKENSGMVSFLSYSNTTAPLGDEPIYIIQNYRCKRYGGGIGWFWKANISKSFNFEYLIAPEVSWAYFKGHEFDRETGEDLGITQRNFFWPRLRMDFKLYFAFGNKSNTSE